MLAITQLLLTNPQKRPFRKLKRLKALVIHWTANMDKGANAIANRNYFQNAMAPVASAHYIVDDKYIIQCVPDDEVAFHVGAKWGKYTTIAKRLMNPLASSIALDSPNNYTIGIEMCVNADGDFQKTWNNTVELTRKLLMIYGLSLDNVVRHFDITGKDCPKFMIPPEENTWVRFKNEVGEITIINSTTKMKVDVDSKLNVREHPSKTANIVGSLMDDEIVDVIQILDGWAMIGENKWVYEKYLVSI